MIVNSQVPYNFSILKNDIDKLTQKYSFIKKETVGFSFLGLPIYSLVVGNGPNQVFYFGSIHANEWIVTPMLMKFIEELSESYSSKKNIYNISSVELLSKTTFYIIPMANPDGVNLVTGNFDKSSMPYKYAQYISSQYPSISFPSGWKANLNGVDLNLQFPAGWQKAKEIKYSQGFTSPAPRDFVGYAPLTEPESLAIYTYTLSHNFNLTIAYHTQGKEIYWQFEDYAPLNAYTIGLQFANASGYSLTSVPYQSSFAGYKDWFLQTYRKPGYTIEAGIGENPLPISQFDQIYNDNLGILVLGGFL